MHDKVLYTIGAVILLVLTVILISLPWEEAVNRTDSLNEAFYIQTINGRGDYKLVDSDESVICYRIGDDGFCFKHRGDNASYSDDTPLPQQVGVNKLYFSLRSNNLPSQQPNYRHGDSPDNQPRFWYEICNSGF